MDRARLHEGIRQMRFEQIFERWERSELSQSEAAALLGVGDGPSGAGPSAIATMASRGCGTAGWGRGEELMLPPVDKAAFG